MNNEKAQIQIQFNWIFVIIIGSVLLIFFFTLISGQSQSTEERIDISQSRYFETIVSATGQKSGTLKEYQIRDISVEFRCDTNTQEYSYSVEDLPARDTTYDIIFSPESLSGDDMYTWTQDWQVPFSAGNFLYITNSDHAYVFYESQTDQFEVVLEGFPKNISYEIIDDPSVDLSVDFAHKEPISLDEVYQRNYERYTFVFLYGEEPSQIILESSGTFVQETDKVVVIEAGATTQNIFEQGTFHFFSPAQYSQFAFQVPRADDQLEAKYDREVPVERRSSYLGRASMYGAIFSEDKNYYECTMEKAFDRLNLVSELYLFRTEQLIANPDLTTLCREALGSNDATQSFFPRGKLQQLYSTTNEFNAANVETAYDILTDLQENNQFILGIANCPPLY